MEEGTGAFIYSELVLVQCDKGVTYGEVANPTAWSRRLIDPSLSPGVRLPLNCRVLVFGDLVKSTGCSREERYCR